MALKQEEIAQLEHIAALAVTRDQIVEEARSWKHTPWVHLGRRKGLDGGVDCAGYILGVGERIGSLRYNIDHPILLREFHGYARAPNRNKMKAALDLLMTRITMDEAGPGDIVWWRVAEAVIVSPAQHLSIITEGTLHHTGRVLHMHAIEGVGKVAEHRLPREWTHKFFSGAWRYPGLKLGLEVGCE